MRFLIPEDVRVLEIGCGIGNLLAALKPSHGVGIDISPAMIEEARQRHPDLDFHLADVEDSAALDALEGQFDYIVVSDTIGSLEDCVLALQNMHRFCHRGTRLVIAYYSHAWEPFLKLAQWIGQKMPQEEMNYLTTEDIAGLMGLADFEVIRREWKQLLPRRLFGIGSLINRYVSSLPLIRRACLRNYLVGRSLRHWDDGVKSCTVVVPCRNEKGNVENAVTRLPAFCQDIEIIFVEGHSRDGTYEEMLRVQQAYSDRDIKVMRQPGSGKADAMFTAFDAARGDVLMILDGDLTVPPEQLSKFWDALKSGKGEFINGSRLVYPMEDQAMRTLNLVANRVFSLLFTWLLNQRFTDTLCGSKVLRRIDYLKLKENRSYFGDFDPFGDFDLIFGAAKMNLKTVEVPIRYAARAYGTTQISRFQHGWLLLKMVGFAYKKLKAL